MTAYGFSGEVWRTAIDGTPGGWSFVSLPPEIADDIRIVGGPRSGFGSLRVEATIGSTTWRTSIFPSAADQSYVLPLRKGVRTAEALQDGARCDVRLRLV